MYPKKTIKFKTINERNSTDLIWNEIGSTFRQSSLKIVCILPASTLKTKGFFCSSIATQKNHILFFEVKDLQMLA